MITDTDLKKLKTALAPEFGQLNTKIEQLNTKADDIKTRLDVLEDNVTGEIAKLQNENLVTSNYRRDLDNHEERITAAEAKLAIAH